MSKEYEKEFFMTEYGGTVEVRPDGSGGIAFERHHLSVSGSYFMVGATADESGAREVIPTAERDSFRLDLTDSSDPVYAEIAAKLAETTPLVARAIELERQKRTLEAEMMP